MTTIKLPGTTFETTYASARLLDDSVDPEICWVDFETTGLENDPHSIPLEVGVMITDRFCKVRAVFQSLIMERNWLFTLDQAAPIVKDMHDKNGLKQHLLDAQSLLPAEGPAPWHKVLSTWDVNTQLFDFLHEYGPGENKMPMAGSTINFDRHFMRTFLPHCNDYLHYRNIDVSTLKNLCKMHNPRVYEALPQIEGGTAHRSIDDIKGSMHDYLFYLDNFLHVA